MTEIIFETTTVQLAVDNLPNGPLWEQDGSCWRAILDQREPAGWRWQPLNWKAFAKGEPEGEMTDHTPFSL